MFISGPRSGYVHIFGQYFILSYTSSPTLMACVYMRHTPEIAKLVDTLFSRAGELPTFPIDERDSWPTGMRWRQWRLAELANVLRVFQGGASG